LPGRVGQLVAGESRAGAPRVGAALVAALVAVSLAGCGGCGGNGGKPATPPTGGPGPVTDLNHLSPQGTGRPNIVFVLTDDLATNLVRYMPHVQQLRSRGASFDHYFVTDSLCCPSRASIFSGRFPHNTGIFSNTPPDGGFHAFRRRGEEADTFATTLQRAGYRTALMGKYLNGYLALRPRSLRGSYVPPGWSRWAVAGNGYPEFNYFLNQNGTPVPYGHRPADYLTDVIARQGIDFIKDSVRAHRPFMLELATFAPHSPYTPAPRNARDFPGLAAPRSASYDAKNSNAPAWLAPSRPLPPLAIRLIDRGFRRRAQAVQAVDLMITHVEQALKEAGVARNTYIVFSSDNGLHMGQHRLLPGKLTAFDSDIRVPLIVAGPGIAGGRTIHKMVENVDLAPTFARLAGTAMSTSIDGHSLGRLLHDRPVARWRDAVLVEHHGPVRAPFDPDLAGVGSGNPVSYEAIRTPHEVYVEYQDGEREYYALNRDPDEIDNTILSVSPRRRARLHATLKALETCRGQLTCWAAGHIARG
jgi:arylsulfatase A-like enzyme